MYRTILYKLFRNSNSSNFIKIFHNLSLPHKTLKKYNVLSITGFEQYKQLHDNKIFHTIPTDEDVERSLESLVEAYKKHERIDAASIITILENSHEQLLKNYGLYLLQCCGTLLVDQTQHSRQTLCESVWIKLQKTNQIDIQYYNVYLEICIQNKLHLDYIKFLNEMKCEANETTYKLLLRCVCEVGDTQQALQIITAMKQLQFVANEQIFNDLVLAHAIKGGLNGVAPILQTMQTAHVPVSSETCNSIIRGLVIYGNKEDLLTSLEMYPGVVDERNLLQLLMALGTQKRHSWLNEVMKRVGPEPISKQNMEQFELMCIHLIHLGSPEVAITFYKKFVEHKNFVDDGDYAFSLLVEMLDSNTTPSEIINIIKNLKEEGLNVTALDKLIGVAFRKRLMKIAWELLNEMPVLRPHYFWPFILDASKQQREAGVFNILQRMMEKNVRPDIDTLEYYCMHLCDSTIPKQLLARLQTLGLTVREILTPLLAFLLKEHKIELATDLCHQYNVTVSSDHLLQPLIKTWNLKKDTKNVIDILKKMSSSSPPSNDCVGQFLIRTFKKCRSAEQYKQYLNLIQGVQEANLNVTLTAADSLIYWLQQSKGANTYFSEMEPVINNLGSTLVGVPYIPHPRDMSVSELEDHLVLLTSKGMETRGVLRRLIQEYCRLGNVKRALELRNQLLSNGYEESPGIKTAIMHLHVTSGNIDSALDMYHSIKKEYQNFIIDEFKIIDLASALVKNKEFNQAVTLLTNEAENRKIKGGSSMLRNCWQLIGSGSNEGEVEQLFQLLVDKGYCKPSNIVLGPLVKIHLNTGNLEKAVSVYKKCTEKYNCTPLQLELLCALVKDEKLEMLQNVLNYSSKVHGSQATMISCIAAFAQNGRCRPLKKLLEKISPDSKHELEKRCERWVNENNILALNTLAAAFYSLRSNIIDETMIYHSIMKIHSTNNDCQAAISFYRDLIENGKSVPKNVADELVRLVQRCKYEMPEDLH